MKTFSVRTFKRLILFVLILMILVPTGFAIFFGIQYSDLKKQLAGGGTADPDPTTTHPVVSPLPLEGEALPYQELYPELYSTARVPEERDSRANTVYLTINTSLNDNTRQILNILEQYDIKATFFVSGSSDTDAMNIMREIANRGHTIGLYSYSGSYSDIYRSVSSYLDDFKQIYDLVFAVTEIKAEIFRFPGGSVNPYNYDKFRELNAEMLRRNFVFFDWNVSAQEAVNAGDGAQRILDAMGSASRGIVLVEDAAGCEAQVEALPAVIDGLTARGYEFQPLTASVKPVIFSYDYNSAE